MTKTEYAQYIASKDWRQRRKEPIADAGHKCERCELPRWIARLVYDQDLHVHHVNYKNLGDEQPEDLEVLCRRCHEIEEFGRSDFKEIKKAKCSVCHAKHWNVYSEICDICMVLFSLGDQPLYMRFNDGGDEPLWFEVIAELSFALATGEIPMTDFRRAIHAAFHTVRDIQANLEQPREDIPF
jgi:hypothetical protein